MDQLSVQAARFSGPVSDTQAKVWQIYCVLFVRDTSALALYPRPVPKLCCELAVVDAGANYRDADANYTRTCRRSE